MSQEKKIYNKLLKKWIFEMKEIPIKYKHLMYIMCAYEIYHLDNIEVVEKIINGKKVFVGVSIPGIWDIENGKLIGYTNSRKQNIIIIQS